jgi:hypothetical protein
MRARPHKMEPMQIALLPLDERPVNTRYPAQTAAIAGATVVTPPVDALPDLRTPADRGALGAWMSEQLKTADGLVASIDLLGHGGLIASRISDEPLDQVMTYVQPLLRRTSDPLVYAFNVIQRTSNADDATEEAPYWAEHGVALYRYSRALDRALNEPDNAAARKERASMEARIPQNVRTTWLTRRLRNHALNTAMLHEAARGVFDLLVIPSDDTSPVGMGARERKHLEALRGALDLGNVLMYPGADDLCSALTARLINHKRKHRPAVYTHYSHQAMRYNIAPYEDRPIQLAVDTQLSVVGATHAKTPEDADVILVINTPFERAGDQDPSWRDHQTDKRRRELAALVDQIARWQKQGCAVAIADVAFPNGAEPQFVDLLLERVDVPGLAAFGGWNTAGNTLGSTLANACVPCKDPVARRRALAHHLLEDWGYQSIARDQLRDWLVSKDGAPAIKKSRLAAATRRTAELLAPLAERIGAAGLPCAPQNVRHPWRRTFEVDFDV